MLSCLQLGQMSLTRMLFTVLVGQYILPYIMKLVSPLVRNFLQQQQKLLLKAFVVSLEFVGVIDGTFILIAKPRNSHEDYSI